MPKYTLPGSVMRELAWACITWAKSESRAEIIDKLMTTGIAEWEAQRIVQQAIRFQHDYPGYIAEPVQY